MNGGLGGHGVDKSHVVYAGANVGKEVGDLFATLAVLLEFPLGADDSALVAFAAPTEGLYLDGLAVEGVEIRLVVECVNMTGTSVHEEEDHGLGLRFVVRVLGSERVHVLGGLGVSLARKESVLGEHSR